jgi:hypothetical protein
MMSAPAFLVQASQGWARLYGDNHTISTGVMFLHLVGLVIAAGAAVAADRATLRAARGSEAVRRTLLSDLAQVHPAVIGGLALMFVTGALMFFSDIETFWSLRSFWVKMGLIALLLGNGLVMKQGETLAGRTPNRGWGYLRFSSLMSIVLWFAVILASTFLAGS